MPTPQEQYSAELNAIIARYGKLEDQTARAVLRLLQDTRQQITVLLSDAENWQAYRLQNTQARVDDLIAQFEAQAAVLARNATTGAVDTGALAAIAPLQALAIPAAFITPTPQLLNTLTTFNAAMITGITDQLRAAVNVQVRNVALGITSPTTAMTNLTQLFGTYGVKQGKLVTSGISAKAEMDIRTEMQTAFNVSNYAQQQNVAKSIPGLTKRWIATADSRTRLGHLRIHNETRLKPIPVDTTYTVYDITDSGRIKDKTEMRFPLDPVAPGWARINCRCTQATIHPEIGVIGSSLDGRIAAEMQRRNLEGRIIAWWEGTKHRWIYRHA